MRIISKKVIELNSKEIRKIICDHLREKGFSVVESNISFKADVDDDDILGCTVDADIQYL